MLEVSDLCCVRGEKPLFSGLDFCLGAGELLYLQGRNDRIQELFDALWAGYQPE